MIDHDGCVGCRYEHESENSVHCVGCAQNAVDKYVMRTNADHIRGMTDEELADFLKETAWNDFKRVCKTSGGGGKCDEMCVPCMLDWLQQPVQEEV